MEGKTVKETAKLLGVSRCRVENLLREKRLWGQKWNRDWIVADTSIVNYQVSRRKYTKKPPMIHALSSETSRHKEAEDVRTARMGVATSNVC